MSERQKVLKEIQGRIALVTVNRPEALNALDQETLAELETVFSGLREDQSVGAVVLTGSGEKAFIAGADIRELSGLDPVAAKEFSRRGQGVMNAIESFPKPVVAAVNGLSSPLSMVSAWAVAAKWLSPVICGWRDREPNLACRKSSWD
jgi:enoyl-CoA hydratase